MMQQNSQYQQGVQQPPPMYDPTTNYYYSQQYFQPNTSNNPPPPPPNNDKKKRKKPKKIPPPPNTKLPQNNNQQYQQYQQQYYQQQQQQQQQQQYYQPQYQQIPYPVYDQNYFNQLNPEQQQYYYQQFLVQQQQYQLQLQQQQQQKQQQQKQQQQQSQFYPQYVQMNNQNQHQQSQKFQPRQQNGQNKQKKPRKKNKVKHKNEHENGYNKSHKNDKEKTLDDEDDEKRPTKVSDHVSKPSSRFDSRSNMLKRRPVSGVPISLQKNKDNKQENTSSHLQLITAKETAKSKQSIKFLKKALKKEVLFDGLGEDMINDIVKVMYKVVCEKDDIIIKQGEYGDAYFVVESGKFHVLHKELNGLPDKIVGECTSGDAFGEGSLLYSIPRAATLKAVELSVVWALDAAKFIEIRQNIAKDKKEKSIKLMKFLKKIPLFTKYSSHDLLQLAQAVTARTYKIGEEMVTQGDEAKEFFIIRRGTADVEITDNNTQETKVVKTLKDGEFFGERGIFLNTKRAATVRAKTACKCYVILAGDFRNLLDSSSHDDRVLTNIMKNYDEVNFMKDIKTKFVNQIKTKLKEFKNIGILGVGSFGRVSLVECPYTKKTFSLKKVRKNKVIETGQEEHVRNERAVLATLNSPFCCRMYATYQDKLNIYFLMEPVLGGELFTVLRWNKRFSEKTARFYAACVVLAFEHLHSKNVIYRDLKPENLLIASNGYCKLVDFGFAKRRNNSCTLCGTPEYLAPEVIQNYPQGFGVDWWELGIFIYEMVVGHAPFQDDPHMKMYEKILTCDPEFPTNQKFTSKVIDIVLKLLQRDVYKRLGAGINGSDKVKKHDWFGTLDWNKMAKQEIKPPYVPKIEDQTDVSNFETYPEENIDETLLDDPNGDVYRWCEDF